MLSFWLNFNAAMWLSMQGMWFESASHTLKLFMPIPAQVQQPLRCAACAMPMERLKPAPQEREGTREYHRCPGCGLLKLSCSGTVHPKTTHIPHQVIAFRNRRSTQQHRVCNTLR